MFENKRKLVIILLIAGIVVLLLLIAILFLWPKNAVSPKITDDNSQIKNQGIKTNVDLIPSSPDRIREEQSYPLGLKQLAMSFAERYGSYSSDSGSKNLNDLVPLASSNMIAKINQSSQLADQSTSTAMFRGFTTKALSFELGDLKSDTASVIVSTQRLTYLGPGKEPNISYRKIELKFIKIGTEWKVDDAVWK
ncbi:MAG: hypothetical protein WCV92_04950 [Candidatus Buchananbacteria bacterium]